MINKIFDETFRDVIDQDTGKQLSTDLLQTHAERIQVAIRKMIDLIEPWSRLVHDPNIKDDRRHYLKELYDERMKNLMQFYNKSKHWPESIVIVNPENQTYSVSKTVLDDMQFYRRELESLNQGFTNDEVAMQTRQTILSEIETFLTQANLINQLGDDTFTSDTGEFNSSSLQTLTARLSQTFRTAIIAIEEYLTGQLTDPKLFKEKRI
jgi:tRNA(Leu) C34 or U34 (ribose-2'-O)-methylase TrmL